MLKNSARVGVLGALALGLGCSGDSAVGASEGDATDSIGSFDGSDTGPGSSGGATVDDSAGTGTGTSAGDGSCGDGVQSGAETDVDCGGPDCPQCMPGQMCEVDEDCDSGVCDNGVCQAPTCYDDVHNGDEDDVDCGGTCPNDCATASGCDDDLDCLDGEFCMGGACVPSDCGNGIQDSHETDIDCGGVDCPPCDDGGECVIEEDCVSMVCDMGVCQAPTCMDGVQNGDETDNDCGGSCPTCPNGADCIDNVDCTSMICDMGVCVAASCTDTIQNGDETDVDCGGPLCPACPDMGVCMDPEDCDSMVCVMGVCQAPTCMDSVQNGDETDVDCGQSCGATCIPGEQCLDGTMDCVEGVCEFNECSVPDCSDSVQNGNETDVDCGNSCGATCVPTEGCDDAADCVEGVCDGVMCLAPMCDDTVQNGDETDVDCGNSCGATCVPLEFCDDAADCVEGVCEIGVCQPPTCEDGVLNGVEGGVDCQGICAQPCTEGPDAQVNTYDDDFQTQPAVAVAPGGGYFVVVWTSTGSAMPDQDTDGPGIFGQMYTGAGVAMGAEFQVNTTVAGAQHFADVDATDTGFVVTWQSANLDGDGTGIAAQRYNSAGAAQGGEIPVNSTTAGPQRRPSVAMEPVTDAFVVCFDSNDDSSTYDVLCRRFNGSGGALATDDQVNTSEAGNAQLPVVARQGSGQYTVVWQASGAADGDGSGVFLRRYSGAGTALIAPAQVNGTTAGDQGEPDISMVGSTGAFVVAWSSDEAAGASTDVFARRYSAAAAPLAAEFMVNSTTVGAQARAAVAVNNDGDFMVAYQTASDGHLTGVFGRRYDVAQTPIGVEFIVNPATFGRQEEPALAIQGADTPVAVWSDADIGFTTSDIRMVRYIGQFP